jgi:outer membrane protein TolC
MKILLLILIIFPSYICAFGQTQNHDLSFYLDQAKNNSPLLKDYQNQMLSLGLDSQMIRASYKPQIVGLSNDLYAPTLSSGWGYDNAVTNGGQLSAQVQASKSIISRNNLATQYQAISLDKTSIGNTAAIARRDLKKTVTAQYILAYGDLTTVNFNKESLDLLKKEETILKGLTGNNVYKQADYLTFYVTLQQQQLLYRQTEIQYRNDLNTLNYLCGIVDTSETTTLPDPEINLAVVPDAYSSEFYRQFTIDSLKNLNQRSVINYSYKPKLNVFADAGYLSSLQYEAQKNFGTSVGLSLSVPIYDGRQKKLKFQKLDIAERTRTDYRDFYLRQYNQQIATLTQQLRATESLIEEIRGQIKYSNTLIDVNGKLLETGAIRITDLVIAINTWLNARNLLNQNYINRLQIINQINYWEAQAQ